ncbi:collagen-like protein [Rhizobium sp. Leaf371]|uniref:collagen-like triple helix repeat-containing protein n=1 Tax=Rhizobium sp. Leaf371 TaxID=1736355 RepID=UPI000AFCE3FF|nr:collagen-like protein [Rhizobium sp. Leaf371]
MTSENEISEDRKGLFPLQRIIKLSREIAPAQTAVAVGALVILSVSVFLVQQRAPFVSVLAMGAAVLVFGVVATLVSAFALKLSRSNSVLPHLVAWAFVGIFILVQVLLITSVFFSVPQSGALFVARMLNAPGILNFKSQDGLVIRGNTSYSSLPQDIRTEVEGDLVGRTAALTQMPPLTLENAILTIDAGEARVISTSELRLSNSKIITNGSQLTIEALRVVSDNGAIVAFQEVRPFAAGETFMNVRAVTVRIHRSIVGDLAVDLSGRPGQAGLRGAPGARGANGAQGDNAASGLFDCRRGPGRGRDGLPGEPGQPGKDGADGGDAGSLIVETELPEAVKHFRFLALGGEGGPGGSGGNGGLGGLGGPGGQSSGLCGGVGPSGSNGPVGVNGPAGRAGREGQRGQLLTQRIVLEQ